MNLSVLRISGRNVILGYLMLLFVLFFSLGQQVSADCENPTPESPCLTCGDGQIDAPNTYNQREDCDDGNTSPGDGCSDICEVEEGWECDRAPSECETICGDGVATEDEECGEPGLSCDGGYECNDCLCELIPECGNGVVEPGEECDDGNTTSGDGCSDDCQNEYMRCNGSVCELSLYPPSSSHHECTVATEETDCAEESEIYCDLYEVYESYSYYVGEEVKLDIAFADATTALSCMITNQFGVTLGSRSWDDETAYTDGLGADGVWHTNHIVSEDDGYIDLLCEQIGFADCDDNDQIGYCGDNRVSGPEACDDGNEIDDDDCSNDCMTDNTCDGPLCGEQTAECPSCTVLSTGFDIIVVLDNSRSMVSPEVDYSPYPTGPCYEDDAECKFNAQWDAIETLIGMIDTTENRVGMMSFSSRDPDNYSPSYTEDGVWTEFAMGPYTPDFYNGIRAHATDEYSHLTNIGLVLDQLAGYVQQYADAGRPLEIIFLTDGSPTWGTISDPEGALYATCSNCYENYTFALGEADALHGVLNNYQARVRTLGYDIDNDNTEITMADVTALLQDEIASDPMYYQAVGLSQDLSSFYEQIFNRYCTVDLTDPACSGCGDGILDPDGPNNILGDFDDEWCDLGTGNGLPGSACTIDCTLIVPGCGDGNIDPGEECDPGPDGSGYTGLGACLVPECCIDVNGNDVCDNNEDPFCGDGNIDPGEECDDGVNNDGTQQAQCADGQVCDTCLCDGGSHSYCEALIVNPDEGVTPLKVDLDCTGSGDVFEIKIVDENNQLIATYTDTQSFAVTHTFTQQGEYTATCYVDGESNLVCNDISIDDQTDDIHDALHKSETLDVQVLESIVHNELSNLLQAQQGGDTNISSAMLNKYVQSAILNQYVNAVVDTIDRSNVTLVKNGEVNIVALNSLSKNILLVEEKVTDTVKQECFDSCVATILVDVGPCIPMDCARPQAGCHYENQIYKDDCLVSCGDLVCTCDNPDYAEKYPEECGWDLSIDKEVKNKKSSYTSGDIINYNVNVCNVGFITGTDVLVTDILPSGLTFLTGKALMDTAILDVSGQIIERTIPVFLPETCTSFKYAAKLISDIPGTYKNTIKIEDPNNPIEEDVPLKDGNCEDGHNPLSPGEDYAVDGTNNRDCTVIVIDGNGGPICNPGEPCECGNNIHDEWEECEEVDGVIVWKDGYPHGKRKTCNISICKGYCSSNCGSYGGDNYCGDGVTDKVNKICVMQKGSIGDSCETYNDCEDDEECAKFGAADQACVDRAFIKECVPNKNEKCDHGWGDEICSMNCTLKGGGGGGGEDCKTSKNPIFRANHGCDNPESLPKCAAIDPPSVQVGEYFPFWWDLEMVEKGKGGEISNNLVSDESKCNNSNTGSVIKDQMLCQFTLYNGEYCDNKKCDKNGEGIKTFRAPCAGGEDVWYDVEAATSLDILAGKEDPKLFSDKRMFHQYSDDVDDWMGRAYFKLDDSLTNDVLGEYKISLDKIWYKNCGGEKFKTDNSRVCEYNFPVSDGFVLHKTLMDTVSNTDLSNYKDVNGASVVNEYLVNIQTSGEVSYQGKNVRAIATGFAGQYTNIATKTIGSNNTSLPFMVEGNVRLEKTANQEVYIYDRQEDGNQARTLKISRGDDDTSFTLIVKNARLAIEGNMENSAIYIVPDGKVIFDHGDDCDSKQDISGLFMAGGGFATPRIRNDDLDVSDRCEDGRLVIHGQLIGPRGVGGNAVGSETGRRSNLEHRFNAGKGTREEDVLDSAALLIKTNAKMWTDNVPGIKFFGETIRTLKN